MSVTYPRTIPRLGVTSLLVALLLQFSYAKVARVSEYPSPQAAVDACVAGDVLVVDQQHSISATNPPSGLTIVGGEGTWTMTEDISDLVFFNHSVKILQESGSLRRVISNSGCRGSRFTHIDSCFFITGRLATDRTPGIEVDGFLRACTFAFIEYSGTSEDNLQSSWIRHNSLLVINATDSIGDGTGTLITGFIAHNSGDWTPIHIINGRGITVANVGSEYTEYSDPLVAIENGVECAIVGCNPGGKGDPRKNVLMDDGTTSLGKYLGWRYGTFRIGGMHNYMVSGVSYSGASRAAVTNQPWAGTISRDPFLSKWHAVNGKGPNLAPNLRSFSLGDGDTYLFQSITYPIKGAAVSSLAQCSTAFLEKDENDKHNAILHDSKLKPGSLPTGPRVFQPYTPLMPEIPLTEKGPGEDMTGKSGNDILDAIASGKNQIFLGEGVYFLQSSITDPVTIYGAGKSKTRLVFHPNTPVCFSSNETNLYNLTVQGGTTGYIDKSSNVGDFGLHVCATRFVGQVVGISVGDVQQKHLAFCEFDSLAGEAACAFRQCFTPQETCGEKNDGNPMIDKFNFYGCVFKNSYKGINPQIGKNGFVGIVGCQFENMEAGIDLRFAGSYGRKSLSHLVAGCTFLNCQTGAKIAQTGDIIASKVIGTGSSIGFTGGIKSVISCELTQCSKAVVCTDHSAVISDVIAEGTIDVPDDAWIGRSTVDGEYIAARIGDNDLTAYTDTSSPVVDQTKPSEPTGLTVVANEGHNVLTWDRSSDPESGILCYIVERGGAEIGRTILRYSANHHLLEGLWGSDGYPGLAVFREHPTVFVDSNAAQTWSESDYTVVAVNSAMIRSDNTMATIRLFPHLCEPQFTFDTDTNEKTTDSVTIPMGSLSLPEYTDVNGNSVEKIYTAVRYSAESRSEQTSAIRHRYHGRKDYAAAGLKNASTISIYTLTGRLVRKIPVEKLHLATPGALKTQLGRGIYVMPQLRKRIVVK